MSKHVELWAMNRDHFVVLTQQYLLLICLMMKVQSRTLKICCHFLFCVLKKKMVTYVFQPNTIF